MPGSMRRFSGTLEHPPTPRQNATDRRHSNASDTSLPDTSHVRQFSQENIEYIPTRITKVTAPKPAANPLQFIKVGPASLYKSAQEQLKKAEEIKKVTKEVRDEAEDWQSNLDNWKSSRRKRQEHIIERVVEVKKFEMEEYDRNRRRSKTFNEMMEERNSRGRKTSLVLYKDEDANDLSELGISTASGKNSITDDNYIEKEETENHNGKEGHHDDDSYSIATVSSPEPEEYTYERAIQGYVNFAETRVKSRTKSNINNTIAGTEESKTDKLSNGHGRGLPPSPTHTPRRQSAAKIEEKLSALEKRRRSSTELNNSVNKDLKMPIAKGELLKRRAMFELASELSEFSSKPTRRLSSDVIKQSDKINSGETSLKKEKSADVIREKDVSETRQRLSNGDLSSAPSIQERLSNLEKQNSVTERKDQMSENCVTETIKERLSNLDSACNKDNNKKVTPDRDPSFQAKLANFRNTEEPEKVVNGIVKSPEADSERSSSPEDAIYETKRQQFHRSLDSLEVEGSSDVERVQSLEDLDCCSHTRNYPASASSTEMLVFSSQSGDTDREDSGIHTADVSCSVSQADEPVEDGEIIATINSVVPHLETNSSGADVYHLEVEIVNQKHHQSPSKETSTAYLDVKSSNNNNIELESNKMSDNKNNTVSPKLDAHASSSLMVVVEENEESLSIQIPECSEHADTDILSPDHSSSLVMAHKLNSTQTLHELSIGSTELEDSHVLDDISTPTKVALSSDSSFDSFTHNSNTAPNSPDDSVLQSSGEVIRTDTYQQVPCISDAADRRKTVVEVCEKIIITGDECFKSPPSTPIIIVSDTKAMPLKEPKQMEQQTSLLSNEIASEESKHTNDQQKANDAIVANAETINKEESSKDCTDNKVDITTEEKILGSKPGNQTDDEVFLPISTSQIPPLELSSDVEIVAGLAFPLGPPTSAEPPKEKPPPPPTELSDEEIPSQTSLKRLDSTKRIKRDIWRKRSDFLGIDGGNDESYLEPELKVAPPPDMTTFLVEERRSEQQLYRQSICSETDSNHGETTDSRDSGVELDRAHSDDWNGKLSSTPEVLSAQHSRQNSDIYGTASITSEEDEIMKKEREIIEILEKEEQWRYRNNTTAEENDIGEKLAVKLHQLEQEKMRLEWERTEEENKRQMKENAQREEELRLQAKEQELRQQESLVASSMKRPSVTGKEERVVSASGEALQVERERLQKENEELKRQKETLQLRESHQLHHNHAQMQQQWTLPHQQGALPPTHLSLQDISMAPTGNINTYQPSTVPMVQLSAPLNYRLSLPDLQQEEQVQLPIRPTSIMPTPRSNISRRPPPPIPPAKPLRVVSQEQRERENSIRNSRMPSADSIPQHVETSHAHHSSVPAHIGSQPISRQTLQALSAVPRSRFISNDMWMQAKKKPENQRSSGRESTYNYQHWLIQEAEHRRITEQQQRSAISPRKTSPPHPHTSWSAPQPQPRQEKPLPDSIIQTLTQRVQNRVGLHDNKNITSSRRRLEDNAVRDSQPQVTITAPMPNNSNNSASSGGDSQEKMLSVSGKKKCSHCGEELGRGAAMIIESLRLFYHIDCFKCCVCHVQLGDGLMGTDVRVRNNKLHCHNCYSSDDGVKFSCV